MSDKRKKRPLVQEDEPSQMTQRGLEIPLPTHEDFFRLLDKATKESSENNF